MTQSQIDLCGEVRQTNVAHSPQVTAERHGDRKSPLMATYVKTATSCIAWPISAAFGCCSTVFPTTHPPFDVGNKSRPEIQSVPGEVLNRPRRVHATPPCAKTRTFVFVLRDYDFDGKLRRAINATARVTVPAIRRTSLRSGTADKYIAPCTRNHPRRTGRARLL